MMCLSYLTTRHDSTYLDILRIRHVAPVWAATLIRPLAAMNAVLLRTLGAGSLEGRL
jgi:hypothetical protein